MHFSPKDDMKSRMWGKREEKKKTKQKEKCETNSVPFCMMTDRLLCLLRPMYALRTKSTDYLKYRWYNEGKPPYYLFFNDCGTIVRNCEFFTATVHNCDAVFAVFRNCVAVTADFSALVHHCGDCGAVVHSCGEKFAVTRNCAAKWQCAQLRRNR